jgi:hypothetical protein
VRVGQLSTETTALGMLAAFTQKTSKHTHIHTHVHTHIHTHAHTCAYTHIHTRNFPAASLGLKPEQRDL